MVLMRLGLEAEIPLPSKCPDCLSPNGLEHALDCGMGVTRILPHNEVRDFSAETAKAASFHVYHENPRLAKLAHMKKQPAATSSFAAF